MAGTPSQVVGGHRAQVMVGEQITGIISSINWNFTLNTQDADTLGRETPAEIAYVGASPVTGSMSGWKVLEHGAFVECGLPRIQDLLTAPYTQIAIFDRATGKRMGMIRKVRLLGHAGGFAPKQLSEISIPYRGIFWSDESVENAEAPGATELPG